MTDSFLTHPYVQTCALIRISSSDIKASHDDITFCLCLTQQSITIERMKKQTPVLKRQRPVRMPESLMEQIDQLAQTEQRSFNWMMNEAARLLIESRTPKKKRSYTRKDKSA